MICPNCKNEVSQGAAFCANCGANLTEVAQPSQPEVAQAPVAQPTQPEAAQAPVAQPAQPEAAQAPVAQPAQPQQAMPQNDFAQTAQPQQAMPQNDFAQPAQPQQAMPQNDFAQPAQPEAAQPYAQNYANPSYQQPINPTVMAAENPLATQALVFGIISAVLGEIGWFTSFVGIILGAGALVMGILGLKKANAALALANQGYNKRPMCIIAKVLSIVGIVSGSLAIFIGIISLFVCGCSSCASNYLYY